LLAEFQLKVRDTACPVAPFVGEERVTEPGAAIMVVKLFGADQPSVLPLASVAATSQ
jgi:hypothetical protein